jgi:hypothetical protein
MPHRQEERVVAPVGEQRLQSAIVRACASTAARACALPWTVVTSKSSQAGR